MGQTALKRFEVMVPDSVENSSFLVNAESHEEAADIYVRAVLEEQISVDGGEMEDAGRVRVIAHGETMERGIVPWDGEDREVALDSLTAWAAREKDGYGLGG